MYLLACLICGDTGILYCTVASVEEAYETNDEGENGRARFLTRFGYNQLFSHPCSNGRRASAAVPSKSGYRATTIELYEYELFRTVRDARADSGRIASKAERESGKRVCIPAAASNASARLRSQAA
eukprot:1739358-Pleurochrysis_carterae.AAC.1